MFLFFLLLLIVFLRGNFPLAHRRVRVVSPHVVSMYSPLRLILSKNLRTSRNAVALRRLKRNPFRDIKKHFFRLWDRIKEISAMRNVRLRGNRKKSRRKNAEEDISSSNRLKKICIYVYNLIHAHTRVCVYYVNADFSKEKSRNAEKVPRKGKKKAKFASGLSRLLARMCARVVIWMVRNRESVSIPLERDARFL